MVRWFLEAPPAFHDQTSQDSLLPLRKSEWVDDFCSPIKQRIPHFCSFAKEIRSWQHCRFTARTGWYNCLQNASFNLHCFNPHRLKCTRHPVTCHMDHQVTIPFLWPHPYQLQPQSFNIFLVVLADFGWLKFYESPRGLCQAGGFLPPGGQVGGPRPNMWVSISGWTATYCHIPHRNWQKLQDQRVLSSPRLRTKHGFCSSSNVVRTIQVGPNHTWLQPSKHLTRLSPFPHLSWKD